MVDIGAVAVATQVKAFQQVERHQNRDAVPVGRQLADIIAAVIDRDRLHPFRIIFAEILCAEIAVGTLRKSDNFFCQRTAVKTFRLGRADLPQGIRHIGVAKHLARAWRPTVDRELAKIRFEFFPLLLAEMMMMPLPAAGYVKRDRVALFRIPAGRFDQFGKAQPPEARRQGRPSCRRAGYGDRFPAINRHLRQAFCPQHIRSQRLGRPTARIQAVQLALSPDQGKSVAADTVGNRLHHALTGSHRHRGIDRIAALFQDLQADLRRLRRRGTSHTLGRKQRIAPGGVRVHCGVKLQLHIFSSFMEREPAMEKAPLIKTLICHRKEYRAGIPPRSGGIPAPYNRTAGGIKAPQTGMAAGRSGRRLAEATCRLLHKIPIPDKTAIPCRHSKSRLALYRCTLYNGNDALDINRMTAGHGALRPCQSRRQNKGPAHKCDRKGADRHVLSDRGDPWIFHDLDRFPLQ